MVASQAVDDRIGLVFSWDPRNKSWVKERGPEDGAPPPAAPIDDGAVQTYFLDPQNGKWSSTILGLRARQISVDLKDAYRAARVAGLAIDPVAVSGKPAAPGPKRESGMPLIAGLAAVFVLVGAGAFVAQAVLKPKDASDAGTPSAATTSATASAGASAPATASASAAASTAPSANPTQTPVRTAAPTAPPAPPTIRLVVRLPNGTQVVYSGPPAVTQNTSFQGIFSVVLPNGQGGNESLTVYLGDPNVPGANTNALGAKPDANGNYVLTIRAAIPKGEQRLSVIYGTTPGIFTLGTINIQ